MQDSLPISPIRWTSQKQFSGCDLIRNSQTNGSTLHDESLAVRLSEVFIQQLHGEYEHQLLIPSRERLIAHRGKQVTRVDVVEA